VPFLFSFNVIHKFTKKNWNKKIIWNFFVFLDGLRVENVTATNALYGLTGYSIIQTQDASTVVKNPNTSNYIEFRFSVDVSGGVTS
jgi:hypothetical protein